MFLYMQVMRSTNSKAFRGSQSVCLKWSCFSLPVLQNWVSAHSKSDLIFMFTKQLKTTLKLDSRTQQLCFFIKRSDHFFKMKLLFQDFHLQHEPVGLSATGWSQRERWEMDWHVGFDLAVALSFNLLHRRFLASYHILCNRWRDMSE